MGEKNLTEILNNSSEKSIKTLKVVITLSMIYTILTMLSNISSLRIIKIFTFSMDAGTLFYPLTFTLRDMLHKRAGRKISIFTIIFATAMNLFMFFVFYIVSILPADLDVGAQTEFGAVLIPGIRIVLGSIVAMLIAELTDTAIYSAVVKKLGAKMQWLRVVLSNAFSVPLDSIIFTLIAFYGLMPMSVLISIIIANITIKYLVTALSVGSIYIVKEESPNQ